MIAAPVVKPTTKAAISARIKTRCSSSFIGEIIHPFDKRGDALPQNDADFRA